MYYNLIQIVGQIYQKKKNGNEHFLKVTLDFKQRKKKKI